MKRLIWLGVALLTALLVPLLMGGAEMWSRVQRFPLSLLLTMLGMIVLCWCLNSVRLRLLLLSLIHISEPTRPY